MRLVEEICGEPGLWHIVLTESKPMTERILADTVCRRRIPAKMLREVEELTKKDLRSMCFSCIALSGIGGPDDQSI